MTNETELRDRIAEALYNHDVRTDYPGEPWVPDFHSGDNRTRPDYQARAQAIIDDLGLTVERRVSSVGRTIDRRTGIITNAEQSRVVGRWEKQ